MGYHRHHYYLFHIIIIITIESFRSNCKQLHRRMSTTAWVTDWWRSTASYTLTTATAPVTPDLPCWSSTAATHPSRCYTRGRASSHLYPTGSREEHDLVDQEREPRPKRSGQSQQQQATCWRGVSQSGGQRTVVELLAWWWWTHLFSYILVNGLVS